MAKHAGMASIQRKCCVLLYNLMVNDPENTAKKLMLCKGGIELLYATLLNHPAAASVLSEAGGAIATLALYPEAKAVLQDGPAVELLRACLDRHGGDREVHKWVTRALERLR